MNRTYSFKVGDERFQFSNVDAVNVVDSGMVFPQYQSLKDNEIKQCDLVFNYKCDSDKCNFDTCLAQMRDSAELKARGLKDTSVIVAETVKDNQQLFTAKEVGGFVLQSTGNSQLFIRNATFDACYNTRIGFLDLSETRRRFIRQHELQKLNSWNSGQIMIGVVSGGIIGVGGTLAALKFFAKYAPK
mmetsp:Transcript_7252/g.10789  ORF Transcript_7252/g.10789 Transcript_7252/m.10789 type:complete len:187 (-) Transcript_7252:31-591(-)|eukprot:CAMPEP_0185024672 /NCGR_PEP_ID=MMETSP1103-20130426/7845_1 /TAXON_ID=36769 /ORGANISM="Paraphysomonas bandaiensis, Strain Caron Lab Isolate" /LENGTH=186 /DNA_ID=CAMNT_0027557705 /DNA_START=90 /DNA_END=650 /DNA_ORIENTATION=+